MKTVTLHISNMKYFKEVTHWLLLYICVCVYVYVYIYIHTHIGVIYTHTYTVTLAENQLVEKRTICIQQLSIFFL